MIGFVCEMLNGIILLLLIMIGVNTWDFTRMEHELDAKIQNDSYFGIVLILNHIYK